MMSSTRKVLILAQRGDWPACDQALKGLEKSIDLENNQAYPLKDVFDPVTGNTPLMFAAMENKIQTLERMIELGADPLAVNREHYSALHLASMYSREETIKVLLLKKADPSIPGGPQEQNSVHLAASRPTSQATNILRILLSASILQGRNLKLVPDKEGNIPLFSAIEVGNISVARELLSTYTQEQLKTPKGDSLDYAVHLAARKGDNDLIKTFIEMGAEVDIQNAEGQTCLHVACSKGDENIIRTLYLSRANPSVVDKEDRTAMHLAAEKGHTSTVEFLADKFRASVFDRTKDGSTLMHIAALNGHPETAMVLFKKGVPLLMPNKSGARGIHTAAAKGHVAVVNSLIAKGESVDAATNDNYTALHLAVEAGKSAVVEALLGHGAQVHIKGGKIGEAPLHIAARIEEKRGEQCSRMLLKSGADCNLPMEDGRTPLHIAAETGSLGVIQMLLESEADILIQDKDGETALHKACKRCNSQVVELLVNFTDNQPTIDTRDYINSVNFKGETGLHYISLLTPFPDGDPRKGADQRITEILMNKKADSMIQNSSHRENAFHYCGQSGNSEVVSEIIKHLHAGQIQLGVNKQSGSGWSPLLLAAKNGHMNLVKIFLDNNARVDVFDQEARSALHLASESGSEEIAEMLLNKNAYINSKTKAGWTPLHYAADKGFSNMINTYVTKHNATIDILSMKKILGAGVDTTDEYGQKPIHLAAQSDQPEVVKLFLQKQPSLVTASTKDGNTTAHIAAKKGSVRVLEELLKFDKNIVTNSRNKITDSTPLHIATEGGHVDVIKLLLTHGASPLDENKPGMTPVHLAARHGHISVINEFVKEKVSLRNLSKKTGMTALHIAAYYGEEDIVRELMRHVPPSVKSEKPANPNASLVKELAQESGLTPLHLAAYSGSENVVRGLLNSPAVQVDSGSNPSGYIPLHLACLTGHVGVVGLLLSRSTELLKVTDNAGKTCLHVAAASGHYDMVQVLIGQGADLTVADKEGWTALHYAAQAGYLEVAKLLVESGSNSEDKTKNGRIALWYAASEGHTGVLYFLIKEKHDSYNLLEDRRFIFNLMACGKGSANKPIEDFITHSPAPVDLAAKMSQIYHELSFKEKERAKDLDQASQYCENLCNDFVSIASSSESAVDNNVDGGAGNVEIVGKLLQATDRRKVPFLDVLIECDQKTVVSNAAVQSYLNELWRGGLTWVGSGVKMILLVSLMFFCPPVWIFFSLPIDIKVNKVPFIKFLCRCVSHAYWMLLIIITACIPIDSIQERKSLIPTWYEWFTLVWLSGLLLAELTSMGESRASLAKIRPVMVFLGVVSVGIHLILFFLDPAYYNVMLFIRNQFLAFAFLISCVLVLDFLSFHYLFGPWAIIISSLIVDLAKFMTVLSLFLIGFTMLITALNTPFYSLTDAEEDVEEVSAGTASSDVKEFTGFKGGRRGGLEYGPEIEFVGEHTGARMPLEAFLQLFQSIFGLGTWRQTMMTPKNPEWTSWLFQAVYMLYMTVTTIVLINLLIAMMSDTYQRIQQQSDIEWKFGLAKLIRSMARTDFSPSPINLVTTWVVYISNMIRSAKKKRVSHYSKMNNAPSGLNASGSLKTSKPDINGTGLKVPSAPGPSFGSTSSFRDKRMIENVLDWNAIVKKYYAVVKNSKED
ncbi:serine/threonine-protein phosphatase 6 regulatory ankyrin repeat subunit C [Eurytemora carolleeae]|uniref:serine/threonine-protein phosphatase 6 regulatory ankyrin repeat subunit C n=1 Tax=Eurytemora carolleeae TaxID=1294199 RepID=UPI000C78009B|nr:serine/threonine-protein phosphatase 6 regulatory ankyrin repeat subunit C [Eurytemora carolleeae]|eukprot:XP_023333094.1 serine/threonine-protein phosphatase 6 regulatory ankyrin repeat subunit C-like [Eurytemora affinis]